MENIDLVQLTQQTKKLSAMIIENNEISSELLNSTFKNFFNEVTMISDATQAIQAIKQKSPDVIFLDLVMPKIDGIELSNQIYNINPNQIIVVISSSQDINKISKLIELGVASFIQKPIGTQKTIEVLSNITKIITKRKKIEMKTFSISLPIDIYETVNDNAKLESISKNAVVIRALRNYY